MNLLERARSLLEEAGYVTTAAGVPDRQFVFEDDNVFGFVCTFADAEEILVRWEVLQDEFIKRHSLALSSIPEKAWNAYGIFLTDAKPTADQERMLIAIEEDFRGARKIARANIKTHNLDSALAPLLPLRSGGQQSSPSPIERIRQSTAVTEAVADALEKGADGDLLRTLFMEGA